jgi:prephenate dehydrogenase
MKLITSYGIIGLGSFGQFIATLLPPSAKVYGYDSQTKSEHKKITQASFEEITQCDAVILAVPLSAYPEVLGRLQSSISADCLVIDVCSVKSAPEEYFQEYFPNHKNILMTHPLFGPQSANDSTKGHKLLVTKSIGDSAEELLRYCEDVLELDIKHTNAHDHDKLMAQVHVLTFFVARGLSSMNLADVLFTTPSYKMIQDLVTFDETHTDSLFQTIQSGNPYASEMRKHFVETFQALEASLDMKKRKKRDDIL